MDFVYELTAERLAVQRKSDPRRTLVFDRRSGAVTATSATVTLAHPASIFGVLGTVKLLAGVYVVLVTKAVTVASVLGHNVCMLLKTEVVCLNPVELDEKKRLEEAHYHEALLNMLETKGFYFSPTYDLTRSQQQQHTPVVQSDRVPKDMFMFNYHLQKDIRAVDASFAMPVIMGFVKSFDGAVGDNKFSFALISRRSRLRTGTRYNVRGIDQNGNVANFVETESILSSGSQVSSYLQTRGSIPLYWSQFPNIRYKPKMEIGPSSCSYEPFQLHVRKHVDVYNYTTMVDLVNQTGSEGKLAGEFRKAVSEVGGDSVRYVPFDFHKECRGMKFDRAWKLVDVIQGELDNAGFFVRNGDAVTKRQSGVVRTNCMDCLDRTNVVQSILSQRALKLQMAELHISPQFELKSYKAFEKFFKNAWADNADALSNQYAGTGALKTDYTRTGKRTVKGALSDVKNSAVRYVKNNFADGHRQDSFDLFTGAFEVTSHRATPFRSSSALKLFLSCMLALVILSIMLLLAPVRHLLGLTTIAVVMTLILVFMIGFSKFKGVETFLNRPALIDHIGLQRSRSKPKSS